MLIYKFFRYFFFIFLIIIAFLFLMRDTVSPIPKLEKFFSKIDLIYNDISNQNNRYNELESQDAFYMFFDTPKKISTKLIKDLRFQPALSRVLNHDFNDIEYLIQEYFGNTLYFEDLIIMHNNKLIYKYQNIYLNSPFTLQYTIDVNNIKVEMLLVFDSLIIQDAIDQNKQLVFIKDKNQLFIPNKVFNRQELIKKQISKISGLKGYENIKNGKIVYYNTLTNFMKNPITIYIIEDQIKNTKNFYQFLFLIFILLILVFCFFIDKMIFNSLKIRERNKIQQNLFSTNKGQDVVDESLSWIDRFVKIEEMTEQESNNKDIKQKNTDLSFERIKKNIDDKNEKKND